MLQICTAATVFTSLNLLVLLQIFLAPKRQACGSPRRLPVGSCRMQRGTDVKGVTHYGR